MKTLSVHISFSAVQYNFYFFLAFGGSPELQLNSLTASSVIQIAASKSISCADLNWTKSKMDSSAGNPSPLAIVIN